MNSPGMEGFGESRETEEGAEYEVMMEESVSSSRECDVSSFIPRKLFSLSLPLNAPKKRKEG